jgi:hypothetical protein
MTNDPLSFVDNQEPAKADAPAAPAQVDPPAADPKLAPVVDPKSAAPDPAHAAPQAQLQPVAEQPAKDHTVPLPKYLDTYNELRETKARMRELEQQLQAKEKPAQAPDPLQDPEGYAQFIREQLTQDFTSQNGVLRVQMSEQMVMSGPQAADYTAARDAFKEAIVNDPYLRERVKSSQHPAQEILNWYRQHKLISEIGSDPDAYVRRRYAELTAADPQNPGGVNPPPTIKPAPQIPAPSLSRAPAGPSSRSTPVGPGQAFDSLFSG